MSRLNRYFQKIFGNTAGNNQLAKFGSFAASTPQRFSGATITPTLIQALSNFDEGWFGAVLGQNSPAIEDVNALEYLWSYQLAYLFQEGIPEWDTTTVYFTGSLAQASGVIYQSLTNNNTGNALTSATNWGSPGMAGVMTPNAFPFTGTSTFPVNQTITYPNLSVGSGQTIVVPSNAYLLGFSKLTVSGTGVVQATGTGIIRVI